MLNLQDVVYYVSVQFVMLYMVFQFDIVFVGMVKGIVYDVRFCNFILLVFKKVLDVIQLFICGIDGWIIVFFENYDQVWFISCFVNDSFQWCVYSVKLFVLLQGCFIGIQYIYQGQEIGIVNVLKELYLLENYCDIGSIGYMILMRKKYGVDNKEEFDKVFELFVYFVRDYS